MKSLLELSVIKHSLCYNNRISTDLTNLDVFIVQIYVNTPNVLALKVYEAFGSCPKPKKRHSPKTGKCLETF